MLTRAQNAKHWRLWGQVHRLQPKLDRHEFYIRNGLPESHLDFSKRDDFDAYIAACEAIIHPADLNVQLRQVRGAHRRAEWSLDRLMRELGVDRNYVQGIIDHMDFEHAGFVTRHPKLDDLTFEELQKVLIALRKQAKRAKAAMVEEDSTAEGALSALKTMLARAPVETPF